MSSMALDSSLDEIISTKKANRSRGSNARRGGGGGARGGNSAAGQPRAPRQQQQQAAPAAAAGLAMGGVPRLPVGDKIVVSNLPDDVTEQQVKELFTSTVGPLHTASLAYNSKGKSTGVATVVFRKPIDATKAYDTYNGRLIDGKRPMKVEIVVDPSRVPKPPLNARLGPAPKASATLAAASGQAVQARNSANNSNTGARRGAGAGAGGRRGGGGGGGQKREPRPKATLESLDAEMSDWQAQAQSGAQKTDAAGASA